LGLPRRGSVVFLALWLLDHGSGARRPSSGVIFHYSLYQNKDTCLFVPFQVRVFILILYIDSGFEEVEAAKRVSLILSRP
jgi:hypothetical protein